MKADLHLHTNWSDGALSPAETAARAAEAGLDLIAVTDHDTLRGSDELTAADTSPRVLPGVELSLRDMDGLHLLLYGLRDAPCLRERLDALARKRELRARLMLDRLAGLGMPIPWEAVQSSVRGSVGRKHIARALLRAGYAKSEQETFDRWLGNGKPAYVAGERMSMAEALGLAAECGWIPVLAHPRELGHSDRTLRSLVQSWRERGLRGIEVYHPSAKAKGFAPLDHMAREMGLLVTGGSDFHAPGERKLHCEIGATCGSWQSAEEDIAALMSAMNESHTV